MVYTFPKCLCGGTLLPIEEGFRNEEGIGRIYVCDKCQLKQKILEKIYL